MSPGRGDSLSARRCQTRDRLALAAPPRARAVGDLGRIAAGGLAGLDVAGAPRNRG